MEAHPHDARCSRGIRLSARTTWLKLAAELCWETLVPGAKWATALYDSGREEKAGMWAWWAEVWFAGPPLSLSEMRCLYEWELKGRRRARRRVWKVEEGEGEGRLAPSDVTVTDVCEKVGASSPHERQACEGVGSWNASEGEAARKRRRPPEGGSSPESGSVLDILVQMCGRSIAPDWAAARASTVPHTKIAAQASSAASEATVAIQMRPCYKSLPLHHHATHQATPAGSVKNLCLQVWKPARIE